MVLNPAARHQAMYELDAARVYPFDTLTKYVHQRLLKAKARSIVKKAK